jgi:pyruvate,orthophosphate dikinase
LLHSRAGARLGDASAPLLLSVRSGAAISMPGMMDTVLNLGLTDEVAAAIATKVTERAARLFFLYHSKKITT